MFKLSSALLIVAVGVASAIAQSNATASKTTRFNWQKCMAQKNGSGLDAWSAAKACAKFKQKRD